MRQMGHEFRFRRKIARLLLLGLVSVALFLPGCSDGKNPCPCRCVEPPAAVSDLQTEGEGSTQARLLWTAPEDDCHANEDYDVRYSTEPAGAQDWWAHRTVVVEQALVPKAAGQAETLLVSGLSAGSTYHFALRSIDQGDNVSALSNVAPITLESSP